MRYKPSSLADRFHLYCVAADCFNERYADNKFALIYHCYQFNSIDIEKTAKASLIYFLLYHKHHQIHSGKDFNLSVI